jgi:hypothetical protein
MLSVHCQRRGRPPKPVAGRLAAALIGAFDLLTVAHQYLIAGRVQLGAILLQTRQNDEIALIDHRAAEALDVARTGLLLLRCTAALLLLGDGAG